MTRKDFYNYAKKYGIAILIAIPVLVCIDVLLYNQLSTPWLIVINCVVLLAFYFITLGISQALKNRTAQKRAEFVANKEKEAQKLQAEEFTKKEEEEKAPQKIIQKQKKNYPSTKRKK